MTKINYLHMLIKANLAYSKKIIIGLFLFIFCPVAIANNSCPKQGLYLQVLGSGGPELDDSAAASGYAIWLNGKIRILVDTGTGSAKNFGKTQQPFNNIDAILFTHFHTDHSADFPAYIKSAFFEQRNRNLLVYGPTGNKLMPSTEEFVQRMIGKNGAFPYLSSYLGNNASYQILPNSIEPSSTPKNTTYKDMQLTSINAEHGPFPALAWRVKVGEKSITFSGDNSGQSNNLSLLANNTDFLVVHNAVPDNVFGVAKNLHMTPSRIGKIAHQAKVKSLLLSHFMKRTQSIKSATQKFIKKNYSGKVYFAKDLSCYRI